MAGLGPHFLLASSRKRWYLWLQRSKTSSKCFWKVSFESKIMPKNFQLYVSLDEPIEKKANLIISYGSN